VDKRRKGCIQNEERGMYENWRGPRQEKRHGVTGKESKGRSGVL